MRAITMDEITSLNGAIARGSTPRQHSTVLLKSSSVDTMDYRHVLLQRTIRHEAFVTSPSFSCIVTPV